MKTAGSHVSILLIYLTTVYQLPGLINMGQGTNINGKWGSGRGVF
jgi:hypothetical protein